MKIDLMGLSVNTETKQQILDQLQRRLRDGRQTFVVTPYSEFYWYAAQNYQFRQAVNGADFALPDGIAILWLGYYMSVPLTAQGYFARIVQALWQEFVTLCQILLQPKKIHSVIPEKISGSDFFWDLVNLASENGLSLYFLGGFEDTPQRVSAAVRKRFPSVRVVGSSSASPNDPGLVDELNRCEPDILFVAYGPVKQELWISQNLPKLKAKLAIGVGGTFDYVAGVRSQPPRFVRNIGLEWLYRLLTQPTRARRIWHATALLLRGALRNKVFMSLPFRENVVGVIINKDRKILMGLRSPQRIIDKSPDRWEFPQGGIDYPGERPEEAVLREVREETGLRSLQVLGRAEQTYTYLWPHYVRPLLFNRRDRRYCGQRQTVYFLRFTGDDSELQPDRNEVLTCKWVEPSEIKSISKQMKFPLIDIALADLPKYIS